MRTHDRVAPATAAVTPDASASSRLDIAVVFTTVKPTLAALRKAAALARGLDGGIRLVVPRIVPFPLQLDQPPVPEEHVARRFRTLLEDCAVDTKIDFRLCRDPEAGLVQALSWKSLVVLGIVKRWWPTQEQRLANWLQERGYHVVRVEVD
jgi:hypothetical protein